MEEEEREEDEDMRQRGKRDRRDFSADAVSKKRNVGEGSHADFVVGEKNEDGGEVVVVEKNEDGTVVDAKGDEAEVGEEKYGGEAVVGENEVAVLGANVDVKVENENAAAVAVAEDENVVLEENEDDVIGQNEDVVVGENEDIAVGDVGEAALVVGEYLAEAVVYQVRKYFVGDYDEVHFQHSEAAELLNYVNRPFQALNEVTETFHVLRLEMKALLNQKKDQKKLVYVVEGEEGWKAGFNPDAAVIFRKREGNRITFGLEN